MRSYGWLLCGIGAGALMLLWMGQRPSPWAEWRPATCMPDACFCEAPRDALVRQPANTVSSLAFCLVAGIVLARPPRGARSPGSFPLPPGAVYRATFVAALMLIGLGSAFFHASLTFVGQTLDVLGMYLVATLLLLHGVARVSRLSGSALAAMYVAGNAALLALLVFAPGLRRYVFAALVVAVVSLEWVLRKRRSARTTGRHLLLAASALALGFGFWALDLTRTLCAPESWLQGHALWHLLGALAALQIDLYYRSEGLVDAGAPHLQDGSRRSG